jgi:hypothetical protein
MVKLLTLIVILSMLLLPACTPRERPDAIMIDTPTTPSLTGKTIIPTPQIIVLPTPRLKGTLTLEEALAKRRSVRGFTEEQLSLEEIGQLLWAA